MELFKFKEILFTKALDKGFKDCEIYFTDNENISISVYEGEVDKYNLSKSRGLSFRGLINNKMGYSYTQILDNDAIDILINSAIESAKYIENEDLQFIYKGDDTYGEVKSFSNELDNIDVNKMIKLTLEMEKESKLYSDKVINISVCKMSYSKSNCYIFNTKGLELYNKSNLLYTYVCPVVEVNGIKYDGMGYAMKYSLEEICPKKIAKESVEQALEKVNGKSVPSGKYKVIIFNEAMVSLLETYQSIFSSDNAQKGLSLLKGKEGEMIASSIVTIIDDPLLENGLASSSFDDEGVATYKKELVSDGKLNTLLYNLRTAYKANIKSTGNGIKASYASPVGIYPTNLYIKKGNVSFEKLMDLVGEGILVTEFAGLHSGANEVTGDFSLAANGFYIKEGKKLFPVEQITVAGNYFELLKNIKEIGDDLVFPLTSVGSPSVVIEELSIAGK